MSFGKNNYLTENKECTNLIKIEDNLNDQNNGKELKKRGSNIVIMK